MHVCRNMEINVVKGNVDQSIDRQTVAILRPIDRIVPYACSPYLTQRSLFIPIPVSESALNNVIYFVL